MDKISKFSEEGFLSEAMLKSSKEFGQQYYEWFSLGLDINKFSIGQSQAIAYHPDNRQECMASALFLRTISLFEGIIILLERCMTNEAKILLRALMETLFTLRAITLETKVAEEYYQSNLKLKRKILVSFKKLSPNLVDSLGKDLNEKIIELDNLIDKNNKTGDLSVLYLARKANLLDFYTTAYAVLSWTVHSNILDVGAAHMNGQNDTYIDSIQLKVQVEEVEKWFMSTFECMVIAMNAINDLFKGQLEQDIVGYENRYKALYQSFRLKRTTNTG